MANRKFGALFATDLPAYSRLEEAAALETPASYADWEQSEEFRDCRRIQADAYVAAHGPEPPSGTILWSAVLPGNLGLLTAPTRDRGHNLCAIYMTSPRRAAAYCQLLSANMDISPMLLTVDEWVEMVRRLETVGLHFHSLDRCPRCWEYSWTDSAHLRTREDAFALWLHVRSGEMARAEWLHERVNELMTGKKWEQARDLALFTLAHVTMDDARFHTQLGEIALMTRDETLRKEAEAALHHTPAEGHRWLPDLLRKRSLSAALKLFF